MGLVRPTFWAGFLVLGGFGVAAEWTAEEGFRWKPLNVPHEGKVGFRMMPSSLTGLYFTNHVARARYMTNQIYLNGSGVTAGDIDADGRVDVFFAGLDGKNRLFRNRGNGRFEDVTATAGVGADGMACTGCALADIDGDRDLDLLVNTIGQGTHLFTNDGQGQFQWRTKQRAPNAGRGGMSMALADVDGDGDLDLYLANYRTWTYRDQPRPKIRGNHVDGKPVVMSFNGRPNTAPDMVGRFTLTPENKLVENGELDAFFLNDGGGRFRQIAFDEGIFLDAKKRPWTEAPFDWGLSVMFRDFNGDLAPDLYVCNDFSSPDRVWLNDGSGKFQLMPALALRSTSRFSMGIDFGDIDRDGHDDFIVMDMLSRNHERRLVQMGDPPLPEVGGTEMTRRPQFSRNTFYRNRGDGTYAEVAHWAGTHAAEWAWAPAFIDVDLDGYEDLLVTNGHERDALNADVQRQIESQVENPQLSRKEILLLHNLFERLATPNVAFRNRGDFTFEDVSEAWGFGVSGVSHGMALADLDGDGDQDVLVNNLNGEAGVFRNDGDGGRVAVRLKGGNRNTYGVGSKIYYEGEPRNQSQEMMAGGRYLSSDEPLRVFACSETAGGGVIEVRWRSGKVSRITGVQRDRLYEIDEAEAETAQTSTVETVDSEPLFIDRSNALRHVHREPPFDDFFRQALLPRGLSELGPGVGWTDINQDGFEDLLIGGSRGARMAVLMNQGGRVFKRFNSRVVNPPLDRDQSGLVIWREAKAGAMVAGGLSNYEDGRAAGAATRLVAASGKGPVIDLPADESSVGPLAMSDFDGDGDLDLFVGGRVVPGRYPAAASSHLWVHSGESFEPSERDELFRDLGLVSGAVWSDLRGDGYPELILACEWGPLRVFENREGKLTEASSDWRTVGLTGWWNGVAAGDFNGDGRMDLIASNWGLNHSYQPQSASALRWYVDEREGPGPVTIVEAYVTESFQDAVPMRNLAAYRGVIPGLQSRFGSFAQFAGSSVREVLGERYDDYAAYRVATFAHTLFLNMGNHFKTSPLPWLSQLAPAFAVTVADVNLDGAEDVFLSQNFFHQRRDLGRLDAGRGLLLVGDGHGEFRAVPGHESGIAVYGEQRGAAFGDYDRDGRVDLVVAQNGDRTRLFRNQNGRRGLRVRVDAGEGNRTGIGTVVRSVVGDRSGPAKEIHGGGGYWSQDSPVVILPAETSAVRIQWPGGKTTQVAVPAGKNEIEIDQTGTLTVIQ